MHQMSTPIQQVTIIHWCPQRFICRKPIAAAQRIAKLAGGDVERALALAGPVGMVRAAFAMIPALVDGTGAQASQLVAECEAAIDRVTAAVEARHAEERTELDECEFEVAFAHLRVPELV